MALNEVYKDAFSVEYQVNTAVRSGMFVHLNGLHGVAETDAKVGADTNHYATIRQIGVFRGTTADATAIGDALYIAGEALWGTALTTTATDNFFVGRAAAVKTGTAGTVLVRINN